MASYICIDLKSFYASVECVERGLDPLNTNLVVADTSRTEKILPIFAQVGDFSFIHHQFQISHFITPWRLSSSADGISGIGGSQMLVFHSSVRGLARWPEGFPDTVYPDHAQAAQAHRPV